MNQVQVFSFRLYITGDAPNSLLAKANLAKLCNVYLTGCHHIEIIDVLHEPERALIDGVYITPTLVKLAPLPPARFVGSLSDFTPIVATLGLSLP